MIAVMIIFPMVMMVTILRISQPIAFIISMSMIMVGVCFKRRLMASVRIGRNYIPYCSGTPTPQQSR